ncbi:MAG: hypothetical protein ABIT23_01780 [Nitrosospira sp.]
MSLKHGLRHGSGRYKTNPDRLSLVITPPWSRLLQYVRGSTRSDAGNLKQIFHQTCLKIIVSGMDNGYLTNSTENPICIKVLAGVLRASLRTNTLGYWLGARCTNQLANQLTIIP